MLRLLVALKLRLAFRSLLLRRGPGGIAAGLAMAVLMSAFWLPPSFAVYRGVHESGSAVLRPVFAGLQLGWLYAGLMLGGYGEAFDLRRLLRYPVRPETVQLLNVLSAPVDVVAFVLLPPLVACVAAAGHLGGARAAMGVGLAALLLVFSTAALLQLLLALLADVLRRDWVRAVGGLVFGLAVFAALAALRGPMAAPGAGRVLPPLGPMLLAGDGVARFVVTAGAPAAAAAAALDGHLGGALGWLALATLVTALLVVGGGRLALHAALAREVRSVGLSARAISAPPRWARVLSAVLAPDLAAQVERELLVYVRTPQMMIGLLTTPFLCAFFLSSRAAALIAPLPVYLAGFLTLTPALNLSANQLGLDREGIRLAFLLPVPPRRFLLARNLTIFTFVAGETLATAVVFLLCGAPGSPADALTALVAIVALVPVLLTVGNILSVRSPWRVAVRSAGVPQGALGSALAQVAVLIATCALLATPVVAGQILAPDHALAVSLGGIALLGAAGWLAWGLALGPAGRYLDSRRELIIDALARPEETG